MPTGVKQRVLMLGSLPMSLSELPLAPAVLASVVRRRGHEFRFIDINLRLYEMCRRKKFEYDLRTDLLQDVKNFSTDDSVIKTWYDSILSDVGRSDVVLINVFSVQSQPVALRLCQLIHAMDIKVTVLMGGIGSHKMLLGGINHYNRSWAQDTFCNLHSDIFGQILLDNHLIDGWQSNVDTDVIEAWLPQRITLGQVSNLEFDIFDTALYQWNDDQKRIPMLGSHGCVRQCTFCDVIKHFPAYSFVEADQLTKDIITACEQTKIHQIQFMDSLVNGSMSNFLSLLTNLAQSRQKGWLPQDFSWSGTYICRPKSRQLDRIHEMLAPSGVDNLIIGVETGSDRVRFEMEKKFLNTDLIYELQAFRRHNIKASALFFPSWPTETEKDFEATLDLFDELAGFAQAGTLESISLGTSGFSLIDGTPIDKNKHRIGLEQGPKPWLWHCAINPELTFWETVRRRLLMAEWCEMLGIRTDQEERFRRYLAFNLEHDHSVIMDYAGPLPEMIDVVSYLPVSIDHKLKMHVVNFGSKNIRIRIGEEHGGHWHDCAPGITALEWSLCRSLHKDQCFEIDFEFPSDHRTNWNAWESGDYYDANGVYLDNISLDGRDITYWGWNQLVDQHWQESPYLPPDYDQHKNLRVVTSGMHFRIAVPASMSLHKYLACRLEPDRFSERSFVDKKIAACLGKFMA